jgi:hypothetical protein
MPLIQFVGTGTQEDIAIFVGIQNCALGAADSVRNLGLLENGIPKFNSFGLSQLNTIRALDDSE